jgi:predicted acetyltransferase
MKTSPLLIIRPTTSEDAGLILHFIKEIAAYEKMSDKVLASEDIIKQSIFIDHHAEAFILEIDEKAIGFALIYQNYSSFLGKAGMYLEDIYIASEHRNKGYGLQVLTFLAKLAIKRDLSRIEWSVLNWNEPSIAFYNKIKAKPMDEWTTYQLSGEALIACSNNQ